MALTQEEVNKIHEEEAERAKARAAYTPKNSQTVIVKKKTGCTTWGCLILIILLVIGFLATIGISSLVEAQRKAQQTINDSKPRYAGDTHVDFKQDIDQSASYYLDKLGEPEGGETYADLPTYTNWFWQKDGFSFNVSFPKGGLNRIVDIQFEDGVCDQDSAYYLNKIGFDYPSTAPITKNSGVMYRWEPYGEYDRLNVYCNSTGTRIVLISQVE